MDEERFQVVTCLSRRDLGGMTTAQAEVPNIATTMEIHDGEYPARESGAG